MTGKTNEIAEILGISEDMVRKYAQQGVFVRVDKNLFDVGQVVRAYFTEDKEPGLTEERTRLTRAQADKAEMDLSIAKLEYWPRSLCVETWALIVKTISNKMLSLKNEIKMAVPHIESDDLIKIDDLVRAGLEELSSSGIPDSIRRGISIRYGDVDAAAEFKGE